MDDNEEKANNSEGNVGNNGEKKDIDEALANEAGQVGARVAADVATGGEYEKVRSMPVVGGVAKGAEKVAGNVTEGTVKAAKKTIKIARILVLFGLAAAILAPIIFLIALIALAIGSSSGGMATSGYYAMRCQQVTVYFADKKNGYEIYKVATYPLEEYVAGVVAGEVAFLGSLEVDKEFAIAARSYFLTHDTDCTIESSDRKQVFRELTDSATDQLAHQAAEETKGQVLLRDGQVYGTQYDAFCSIAVDDQYYTIKQQNQKIPRSWVDSQRGIAESWKQGTCAGNHGNGLSQWGSLYLANEEGYTYTELLGFYLGDEVTISTGGFTSSIAGLEIKDTSNATQLNENLGNYLIKNGSSIDEMNDFIRQNVRNNGAGTRAGVVTAAVSAVNYLYDNGHVTIPYYWGGKYMNVGINPNFGERTTPSVSKNGSTYYYAGFDCSGFASWAIRNGGYNFQYHSSNSFHSSFSQDSCNISSSSCIGQPGDLINSAGCHVQMIVSVDEASSTYYVAESTGSKGVIMRSWGMHNGNCGSTETRIIHMDSFYNNMNNVDTAY